MHAFSDLTSDHQMAHDETRAQTENNNLINLALIWDYAGLVRGTTMVALSIILGTLGATGAGLLVWPNITGSKRNCSLAETI